MISFEKAVPGHLDVTKAKLILFLRTGKEGPAVFWTRVKVDDGNEQQVHWTYAERYNQQAISYNS